MPLSRFNTCTSELPNYLKFMAFLYRNLYSDLDQNTFTRTSDVKTSIF